jgi:hypothetical protein
MPSGVLLFCQTLARFQSDRERAQDINLCQNARARHKVQRTPFVINPGVQQDIGHAGKRRIAVARYAYDLYAELAKDFHRAYKLGGLAAV